MSDDKPKLWCVSIEHEVYALGAYKAEAIANARRGIKDERMDADLETATAVTACLEEAVEKWFAACPRMALRTWWQAGKVERHEALDEIKGEGA